MSRKKEQTPEEEAEKKEKERRESELKIKLHLREVKAKFAMKMELMGINEINAMSKLVKGIRLPNSTMDKPYQVDVKDYPNVKPINAPMIGLLVDEDPDKCVVRNMLRVAQLDGTNLVAIPGDLIFIDPKRMSNLTSQRARLSGVETNPRLLEDPEDAAQCLSKGEPVYLSMKEKLDHVMDKLKQVFTDAEGKPVFTNGEIVVSFGATEERIANYYASEKINAWRIRKDAEKQLEIDTLRAQKKAVGIAPEDLDAIDQAIMKASLAKKKIKGTATNHEFFVKARAEMMKYMLMRIEASIPGCKVISTGTGVVKVCPPDRANRRTVELSPDPDHGSSDTKFGRFIEGRRADVTNGNINQPDVVIRGGLNHIQSPKDIVFPLAQFSGGGMGSEFAKQVETSFRAVTLLAAPVSINPSEIKRVAKEGVSYTDPLMKMVTSPYFAPGVAGVSWPGRILSISNYSIDYLSNDKIFASENSLKKNIQSKNMFYGEIESDLHIGHQFAARYHLREFPYRISHYQLIHYFLYAMKAPIAFYANMGDIINGKNYATEMDCHPDKIRAYQFGDKIQEIIKSGLTKPKQIEKLSEMMLNDALVAGIIRPEDQMRQYFRTDLESKKGDNNKYVVGLKYRAEMLKRAQRIGLKAFGDWYLATYIEGNHAKHTFEGKMSESTQIAHHTREALRRLGFSEEFLDSQGVGAPYHGTHSCGFGMLGITQAQTDAEAMLGDDYVYAFCGEHKPAPGMALYVSPDQGRNAMKHHAKKGQIRPYQQGRQTIRLAGDIHNPIATNTPHGMNIVAGGQVFHDSWSAFKGLELKSISTVILGLPKDGPHTGPTRTIHLRYEDFREYVKKPWKIRKKQLFPNAMG